MRFPIRAAAAVGAGRERSQHVWAFRLGIVRLVERIVVRVEKFAWRPLGHRLIRVHHETALTVVLLVEILAPGLTWMLLVLLENTALDHLVKAAVIVELMQLKVVGHFFHQQRVVWRKDWRLLVLGWRWLLRAGWWLRLLHLHGGMLGRRDRCCRRGCCMGGC